MNDFRPGVPSKLDKAALRREFLATRRELPPSERAAAAQRIADALFQHPRMHQIKRVALYSPIRGEVPTAPIAERCLSHELSLLYPRVVEDGGVLTIELVEVGSPDELSPGYRTIAEPTSSQVSPIDTVDLVCVPGTAFDRQGYRIGYGAGCYDRLLACSRKETWTVGLAYDFQCVERVPHEPHDIPLQAVLSPNGWFARVPGGPAAP